MYQLWSRQDWINHLEGKNSNSPFSPLSVWCVVPGLLCVTQINVSTSSAEIMKASNLDFDTGPSLRQGFNYHVMKQDPREGPCHVSWYRIYCKYGIFSYSLTKLNKFLHSEPGAFVVNLLTEQHGCKMASFAFWIIIYSYNTVKATDAISVLIKQAFLKLAN